MSRLTSTKLAIYACICSISLTASPLWAQDDAIRSEVRAAAAAYVKALQRGDAAEIAEFWTDDGVYVDVDGNRSPARERAREEFAEKVTAGDADAQPMIDSTIDLVGPNVALEQSRVEAPPADAAPPRLHFMAAWVKQNDRWRLSMLREFAATPSPAAAVPVSRPLGELDWMVGHWTATQGAAEIELTV
jgi:uncharacterized protein (TIGR02246 family)